MYCRAAIQFLRTFTSIRTRQTMFAPHLSHWAAWKKPSRPWKSTPTSRQFKKLVAIFSAVSLNSKVPMKNWPRPIVFGAPLYVCSMFTLSFIILCHFVADCCPYLPFPAIRHCCYRKAPQCRGCSRTRPASFELSVRPSQI